jgi:hypothetical protein
MLPVGSILTASLHNEVRRQNSWCCNFNWHKYNSIAPTIFVLCAGPLGMVSAEITGSSKQGHGIHFWRGNTTGCVLSSSMHSLAEGPHTLTCRFFFIGKGSVFSELWQLTRNIRTILVYVILLFHVWAYFNPFHVTNTNIHTSFMLLAYVTDIWLQSHLWRFFLLN